MTVTAQLLAHQAKAGQPIRVSARRIGVEAGGSPSWVWFGIGVTLTATPPSTFAGFAYYTGGSGIDGVWRGTDKYDYWYDDTAAFRSVNRLALTRVDPVALDANFVVGRYLWFVASSVDPPISATVPEALSTPYLIR